MPGFKGQEAYSIDVKGRVNIPLKMRRVMTPESNDTFVITRGTNKCIEAFPMEDWKKYEERLQQLNHNAEKDRYFLRMILSWCDEVVMDGQQRIAIPKRHLDYAGISNRVTIVGVMDRIELWNPEEFEKYQNSFTETYEQIAATVMQ
ncbi:MAG: division/cell wall cluster transcriptional repressor MraZ [Candidatus Kapaibacterium sp.]